MRIWTVHPKYLDARGLVAVWRETLLAKRVLQGRTRGYRHHPQLIRFRSLADPVAAIDSYLAAIHEEASSRGYRFDRRKIGRRRITRRVRATSGQLDHEWRHLLAKLLLRDPVRHRSLAELRAPEPHPLFRIVVGRVGTWERTSRSD